MYSVQFQVRGRARAGNFDLAIDKYFILKCEGKDSAEAKMNCLEKAQQEGPKILLEEAKRKRPDAGSWEITRCVVE